VESYTTEPHKGGCGKLVAIGCAIVFLLAVMAGVGIYFGFRGIVTGVSKSFTDPAPLALPVQNTSPEDEERLFARVHSFAEAIQGDEPVPALALTNQEINTLIQRHPEWNELADKVYIRMEENVVHARASIPLTEMGDLMDGRYLNGAVTFRIEMVAGRLLVFIDKASVQDISIPEAIMKALRSENLAQDANSDPETAAILEKLDSISIRDSKLLIVPRQTNGEISADTEINL